MNHVPTNYEGYQGCYTHNGLPRTDRPTNPISASGILNTLCGTQNSQSPTHKFFEERELSKDPRALTDSKIFCLGELQAQPKNQIREIENHSLGTSASLTCPVPFPRPCETQHSSVYISSTCVVCGARLGGDADRYTEEV